MGSRRVTAVLVVLVACTTGEGPATRVDSGRDAGSEDAGAPPADAPTERDTSPADATRADGGGATLSDHRDRLLASWTASPCVAWNDLDESQRAIFLTLTHRLWLSATPDGLPMIAHVTGLYAVLGGGADGTTCGGIDNNRLFLSMDGYLWQLMVDTWNETAFGIGDGGGSTWVRTRDIAGPHDPFDASVETDTGLDCVLLVERSSSRPPTGQAHFFLEGSATVVERGASTFPADPYLLEIDHDYNCTHQSNPTCSDYEQRYRDNYGDFECSWVPAACDPIGSGCYLRVR